MFYAMTMDMEEPNILYRDPEEIRCEIASIRLDLHLVRQRLLGLEQAREGLTELLESQSYKENCTLVSTLEEILEEIEEVRHELASLAEEIDVLKEELEEAVMYSGGFHSAFRLSFTE